MKAVQFVLSYPMCFFGSLGCFIVAFVHFSAKNVGLFSGLMVSAVGSGASGPGSSHGHCCILGQDTLL